MKTRANWFNLIFIALALIVAGCQTDKPKVDPKQRAAEKAIKKKYKKERATIELFIETSADAGGRAVPVFREKPIYLYAQTNAFLDSRSLSDAALVEYSDGFGIELYFDEHGRFVLDTMTTAHRGRRLLVRTHFPEARWLAAPLIRQRNTSGVVSFTPDATREETEKIVWGIKNLAVDMRRRGQIN